MTEHKLIKQYRIRDSDDREHYHYVQVGENGQDLNTSETYTRREDAKRGIYDANPEVDEADIEIVDESGESQR